MSTSVLSSKAGHRCAGRVRTRATAQYTATTTKIIVKEFGTSCIRGTARKQNEDRWDVKISPEAPAPGEIFAYASVFDGHGGYAVSEYLQKNFFKTLTDSWDPSDPEGSFEDACAAVDDKLLQPGGFMGLGERGVGGSKCGSTSASVLLFNGPNNITTMLAANVGDSRVILVREGQAIELSEEHVPDREDERLRIEKRNPNPKVPMVKYINGTWRVGNDWGYLALSRAFGDAFLKAGYTRGLGLLAEPSTMIGELGAVDTWLVVSSDGLHSEESRGGGGGLDNQDVANFLTANSSMSCDDLAKELAEAAVARGSTDDVTVVLLKLAPQ